MDLGIHCNVSSERNNHQPKNKTVLKYLYLGGWGSSADGGSVHVKEQHHLPLMKSLFTFSWSSSMMLCFFSYSLFLSVVCPEECLAHTVYPHTHTHTPPGGGVYSVAEQTDSFAAFQPWEVVLWWTSFFTLFAGPFRADSFCVVHR